MFSIFVALLVGLAAGSLWTFLGISSRYFLIPIVKPIPLGEDETVTLKAPITAGRATYFFFKVASLWLLLLLPTAAHAAPLTLNFTAGDLSGWYTVDSTAQGQRDEFDGFTYANAISAWHVDIGNYWSASGSEGVLTLALNRGEWGETWYQANMFSGRDVRVSLGIWSPAGDNLIDSESPTAVPDFTYPGTETFAAVFDERRIVQSRNYRLSSLRAEVSEEASSASLLSAPPPSKVPEPSTLLMLGLGVFATAVRRRFNS